MRAVMRSGVCVHRDMSRRWVLLEGDVGEDEGNVQGEKGRGRRVK